LEKELFNLFIKVNARSKIGEYKALIALDHIGTVVQSAVGCQIVCKNGDLVPVKDDFVEVEKLIKRALGGSGRTIMV